MITVGAAAAVIFAAMLVETRLSQQHEAILRRAGAIEPRDDVYPWMRVVYPTAFVAMLLEGWWRTVGPGLVFTIGLIVFVAAKGIKYWAMATLGTRWTFRVLVPPRSTRTLAGPYRWLRHPNYVGVALELIAVAIGMRAMFSGPLFVVAFLAIMGARIRVEERALGLRTE